MPANIDRLLVNSGQVGHILGPRIGPRGAGVWTGPKPAHNQPAELMGTPPPFGFSPHPSPELDWVSWDCADGEDVQKAGMGKLLNQVKKSPLW